MTEARLENIAKIVQATVPGCNRSLSDKIVDRNYTYWCDRGDTTKGEHLAWLESATDEAIAAWVASIARDVLPPELEPGSEYADRIARIQESGPIRTGGTMNQLPSLTELTRAIRQVKKDWGNTLREWKDSDEPNLTLGFDEGGYALQLGSNQFTGAAYGFRHWATGYLEPRSNCRELAREMLSQARAGW